MQQTLLIASSNDNKLAELRALCLDLPIHIVSAKDLSVKIPPVEEDQPDFLGNARKKALHAAIAVAEQGAGHVWALADDSGLAVDALCGAPGVHSARYSGVDGPQRDQKNNAKLLQQLGGIEKSKRTAAFHCALVVASPTEILFSVEASVCGRILHAPDGESGFGYDPVFFHEGLNTSFAHLSTKEKSRVSHRGQAVQALRLWLKKTLDAS